MGVARSVLFALAAVIMSTTGCSGGDSVRWVEDSPEASVLFSASLVVETPLDIGPGVRTVGHLLLVNRASRPVKLRSIVPWHVRSLTVDDVFVHPLPAEPSRAGESLIGTAMGRPPFTGRDLLRPSEVTMAPRARPGSRAQVLVVVDAGPNPGQLQGFEIVYQDRGHLYGLRARQRIHVG